MGGGRQKNDTKRSDWRTMRPRVERNGETRVFAWLDQDENFSDGDQTKVSENGQNSFKNFSNTRDSFSRQTFVFPCSEGECVGKSWLEP